MSFERHGARGRDDLAEFNLRRGRCNVCGRRGVVLRYRRNPRSVPPDMRPFWRSLVVWRGMTWRDLLENPSSILRKAFFPPRAPSRRDGALGVTCGCYGRWMRQLAHIDDSVNADLDARARRLLREADARRRYPPT